MTFEFSRLDRNRKNYTTDQAHEELRQQFLDSNKNDKIIQEEIEKSTPWLTHDEQIEFMRQVHQENTEFVENDDRTNWKLLNLDEDSQVFNQTQTEYGDQNDEPEDYINEKQYIEQFCDDLSGSMYSEEKLQHNHSSVCPICYAVLQLTNGMIVCETDNCIQIEAPSQSIDLHLFSSRFIEEKNYHLNHDGWEMTKNDFKLGVYSEPEIDLEQFSIRCMRCNHLMFFDI